MKLVTNCTKEWLEDNVDEAKVFKLISLSAENQQRRNCDGGGTKPSDIGPQICPFCQHHYVDSIHEDATVGDHNKKVMEDHSELLQSHDACKRREGPVQLNSKFQAHACKPETPKHKEMPFQFHGCQMVCARKDIAVGSTRNKKCVNDNGMRHPSVNNRYSCHVFLCKRKKACTLSMIPKIQR